MALCVPSPTLTLYATSTLTTVITTFTLVAQTQSDGTVSTVTVPEVITTIINVVNPTSTLFASCSGPSTPISSIPSSLTSSQPSSSATPQATPTIVLVTTTPSPTVVTAVQSSTLDNGVITVVTVTATSTPSATVVAYETSVATAQQSPTSKSSSSNIAPIAGGAVGGFFFLVGLVAAIWFISKKCRKADAEREEEEEDVVFPYPVTRDRDQTRSLDLVRESRPYEYGLVGRSSPVTASRSSPGLYNHSRASDERRDSAMALIGSSTRGLPPMTSAPANVASIKGTQPRGGDVGRRTSYSSTPQLPPGAAPPGAASPHPHGYHLPSVAGSSSVSGSSTAGGPPSRRPLQVINAPLSPMSVRTNVDVSAPGPAPMAAPEPERRLSIQKIPTQDFASSSGALLVHSDGGHIEGSDRRPSASGSGGVLERKPPAQPIPTNDEHTDAPPAYAE